LALKPPPPLNPTREARILALGEALNALVSQSRAVTTRAAATFHDELQPAAFHVALWLGAFGPAKPSAIAEAVGMDRSATSRLIRDLARLNLVDTRTDPADGRGVLAGLSLEGRRRLDLAMAQKAAAFNERLWDWNDDDLAHLAALLRRLTAVPATG
jgi:DNA-binding MarR family transcriptional regulator